ncbi:MAG: radical SAM protein [Methanoregula sp.]|uniref:tetraether lipid synthase Tes n=1 Tax=Methanoregula sp. TaxID=2052170 RepID=UPI003BB1C916
MAIKKTRSLCPVCGSVLEAEIIEEEGKIWLVRTCPEHGKFRHLYWSDAEMYHRFARYDAIGRGVTNPQNPVTSDTCPTACGLCSNHHSGTLLANIDLTNRCNLDCDFCFANARACGFVYEPSFDEIVKMMQVLRNEKPVPAPAVQFSGGEPTMRDDLVEIVKKAKELGFPQVQIATNGVKLANNPALAQQLKDVGLSTVYLHFDGISPATNPFLKIHLKALENLNKVGLGVVLVPTIIKGRNDNEVGEILKFAADHISIVRGVNFQPVAFTGAAKDEDVEKERITIPELIGDIETQTDGILKKSDFYPVPCVLPFSDLVEAYTGRPQVRFTAHEHCGAATYVFVTKDGMVPVTRMVDVESLFAAIEQMANKLKKGGTINKYATLLEGVKELHASFKKGEKGSTAEFWKLIGKTLIGQNFDALREFHWNALFIGTMHFMDKYNYDIERVQRCCIHYATPDGKLIPFCTYNSGPVYREQVWKKFAKEQK